MLPINKNEFCNCKTAIKEEECFLILCVQPTMLLVHSNLTESTNASTYNILPFYKSNGAKEIAQDTFHFCVRPTTIMKLL